MSRTAHRRRSARRSDKDGCIWFLVKAICIPVRELWKLVARGMSGKRRAAILATARITLAYCIAFDAIFIGAMLIAFLIGGFHYFPVTPIVITLIEIGLIYAIRKTQQRSDESRVSKGLAGIWFLLSIPIWILLNQSMDPDFLEVASVILGFAKVLISGFILLTFVKELKHIRSI